MTNWEWPGDEATIQLYWLERCSVIVCLKLLTVMDRCLVEGFFPNSFLKIDFLLLPWSNRLLMEVSDCLSWRSLLGLAGCGSCMRGDIIDKTGTVFVQVSLQIYVHVCLSMYMLEGCLTYVL